MTASVVVLDYGSGNVRSAARALARAGAEVEVSADPARALGCDGLAVPGVGAFAACLAGIEAVGGDTVIRRRIEGGRPVLGICVGMQVLFESGDEHGVVTKGLGVWPDVVARLRAGVLPHMGWNTVSAPPGSALFAGVEHERFYFVHSYAAKDPLSQLSDHLGGQLSWSEHGERFVAAVEDGAVAATQFHPEKSGDAGAQLLENWLRSLS